MDTYRRGYEITQGRKGRRPRLWSWRVPTCDWRDTGWTDKGHLMNYLDGRDDYGKEAVEASFGDGPGPDEERKAKEPYVAKEMTSLYCDDPEELREAWQAGKDGRPFVIQKAGEEDA